MAFMSSKVHLMALKEMRNEFVESPLYSLSSSSSSYLSFVRPRACEIEIKNLDMCVSVSLKHVPCMSPHVTNIFTEENSLHNFS